MSGISTHILDTAAGRPVAGVPLKLFAGTLEIASAVTNADGRVPALLPPEWQLTRGLYRIVFDIQAYWPEAFYPEVSVTFSVGEEHGHYHIPLLLSPFGFTTYRGS